MSRPYPQRSLRWITAIVCYSFIISSLTIRPLGPKANASAAEPQQAQESNGKARKVNPIPPRKGPPPMTLPDLGELKQTQPGPPRTPPPIPSTIRSRHKLLQPGDGQSFAPATVKSNASSVRAHHARMIANTMRPQSGPSDAERAMARLDPFNQSGDQLAARDCEWSLPLLSLPGRAGLDLGLTLSYSSLVWTRVGDSIYFDEDNGTPSPGFRLGFPTIGDVFFDAQASVNARLLMTSAGKRVELRQVGTTNTLEAADSSYLQLVDNSNSNPAGLTLRTSDGTQISYEFKNNLWLAKQVKDRNGNLISITNKTNGDIDYITDTLGRIISFVYDTNDNLQEIDQDWNGVLHQWATFGWDQPQPLMLNVSHFVDVTVVAPTQAISVLTQVGLRDGSSYSFEYNDVGQVKKIERANPADSPRAYTAYDYDNPSGDCPRLTQTRVWVQNWSGIDGIPNEVTTQYAVGGVGVTDWVFCGFFLRMNRLMRDALS